MFGGDQQGKRHTLEKSGFGARVAEEEINELADYFVETDQWRRLYRGEVDVVYGPKGSGKSALYSLLIKSGDALFDRNIAIIPAEQPRGAPAFKDIVQDPPTTEREFIALWKLYLLCLSAELLREYDVRTPETLRVLDYLRDAKLIEDNRSPLTKLVKAVRDYARRLRDAEGVESGISFDPHTGVVTGLSGRIILGEPSSAAAAAKIVSVDSLFDDANRALQQLGFEIWLALDRLDVAFADEAELEANALRALFKVYLDLAAFDQISLKIFLRSDIWGRIMESGFREASHITRHQTIIWSRQALLQLIVRRILRNESIRTFYDIEDAEAVLSDVGQQQELYNRVFPDQVDLGPNRTSTSSSRCNGSTARISSGQPPFSAENEMALRWAHANDPRPTASAAISLYRPLGGARASVRIRPRVRDGARGRAWPPRPHNNDRADRRPSRPDRSRPPNSDSARRQHPAPRTSDVSAVRIPDACASLPPAVALRQPARAHPPGADRARWDRRRRSRRRGSVFPKQRDSHDHLRYARALARKDTGGGTAAYDSHRRFRPVRSSTGSGAE